LPNWCAEGDKVCRGTGTEGVRVYLAKQAACRHPVCVELKEILAAARLCPCARSHRPTHAVAAIAIAAAQDIDAAARCCCIRILDNFDQVISGSSPDQNRADMHTADLAIDIELIPGHGNLTIVLDYYLWP